MGHTKKCREEHTAGHSGCSKPLGRTEPRKQSWAKPWKRNGAWLASVAGQQNCVASDIVTDECSQQGEIKGACMEHRQSGDHGDKNRLGVYAICMIALSPLTHQKGKRRQLMMGWGYLYGMVWKKAVKGNTDPPDLTPWLCRYGRPENELHSECHGASWILSFEKGMANKQQV